MNHKISLHPYTCIPSNKLLNSNSWKEASSKLEYAHKFPLILFISHRWESLENPDLRGLQYRAVKRLIEHILSAIATISLMDRGEHHRYISDLGKHGVLQGAVIATRVVATVAQLMFDGDGDYSTVLEKEPERLIGIWYDVACLPQGNRSQKEELEFRDALQHLPEFVQHPNVSVVALREDLDDYEQRGWCMMEFMLATKQSTYAPLVYRYDLDGEKLQLNSDTKAGLDFATYLKNWQKADKESAFEYWRAVFLQTNTLPDAILNEEKTALLSIRTALAKFVVTQSAFFIAHKNNSPTVAPIEILRELQAKTNLHTTLPKDGVLVYLMILVGGCSLDNPLREEFLGYLREVIMLRET